MTLTVYVFSDVQCLCVDLLEKVSPGWIMDRGCSSVFLSWYSVGPRGRDREVVDGGVYVIDESTER